MAAKIMIKNTIIGKKTINHASPVYPFSHKQFKKRDQTNNISNLIIIAIIAPIDVILP